jgi:3-oxoacyl-[acyl-carrier protein] reductase
MKVAVITGGSKGIGYAVAESLLKEGYCVAITSRTIDGANKAAAKLVAFGDVLAIEADVKNYQSQQDAINLVLEKWGQIDVLIANAGVGNFASIEDLTVEDWNETIDTNLTGALLIMPVNLA